MRGIFKILGIGIVLVLILFLATSTVLFLAEDHTEGVPGEDMAALWSLNKGFQWIYPGSSFNVHGQTLHNVHYDNPDDPYKAAKEIIEYTYNVSSNICVVINNDAAEAIFGGDIIGSIRENDWGSGMSRGDAVENAMKGYNINPLGVIKSLLTGDVRIMFI